MNVQRLPIFPFQRLLVCLALAILCSLFSPITAGATVGGPDDGGYVFVDSLEAQCDTAFTDISSTGTALDLWSNGGRHVILPFNFTFYGQTSTDLYIKNRGVVLFDSTYAEPFYSENTPLPTSAFTAGGWFTYWDNLDNSSGDVYYETIGTMPNRQFIVQWHDRDRTNIFNESTVTLQLVLYESTNNFDFVYGDVIFGDARYDAGASATIGIQSMSGTSYLQYSYNDNSFFNNGVEAICFFDAAPLTTKANTDQALPGDHITYTLTLQNSFDTPITDVVLTETLPTSFTVTSVISNGLSITETSTQPYVWEVGTLEPGSGVTITISGMIENDLALLGKTITSTASITGNGLAFKEPVTTVVHIPLPDLSNSDKTALVVAPIDQPLNYQIVLTNSAIMTATDVILIDPIPTNTVYITGSVTGATYNPSLNQIEWSGDIEPSSEITLTYAVSITAETGAVITNTATLIHTYLSTPMSLSVQSLVTTIKSVEENFCIDFEDGVLPPFMRTETTTGGNSIGRVQVQDTYVRSGNYSLQLDTDSGGESIYTAGFTTQAAILSLDMSAVTDAELSFWVRSHFDENHYDQDGLFISNDGGATYHQLFTFHNNTNQYHNGYYRWTVDFDEVMATHGMTSTQALLLKFQSYDNGPVTNTRDSDGFSIDDICITAQPAEIDLHLDDTPIVSFPYNTDSNTIDFGETPMLFGSVEQTFTIHNTGTGTLFLDDIGIGPYYGANYYLRVHEDFEIVQSSPVELMSGLSTTFRVAFSPTASGLRQALITVFNNDEDESSYIFGVQGSGVISPLVSDGTTFKIASSTYAVEGSPLFGYGSISLDVEAINLSQLEDAQFEIKYDPTTFSATACDNDGLMFELIQCDISRSLGRIQIHVNASSGVSGDELLTRLTFEPQTNNGIGVLQIVPTLLINGDNEFVEPILEHGLITFVSELEPTETPSPEPTSTLPPGIDDGSTIRIESYTQSIQDDLLFHGYGSYPFDVEGLNLSNLIRAKFEVIYDNELLDVNHCDPSTVYPDGKFSLISCEIDDRAGKIEIEVEASEGVSGDESLVFIEMAPYYDEGVGLFQIVPILFMNEAGEVIDPTIENGEITLVPLEPTETPAPVTPTTTPCPQVTREPFRIDPIDSPVHTITQTVTAYIGNGESVTIRGDSGVFTVTGSFDSGDNPAQLEITLLPDQVNTFTVEALVKSATVGGCPYGGYTLGQTLRIEHQTLVEPTDTPAPTDTVTVEPTNTLMPTDTATVEPTNTPIPTNTATATPTDTLMPTDTVTVEPTNTPPPTNTATVTPTSTPMPTDTATAEPTNTLVPTQAATEQPTDTPLPTNTMTPPVPTSTVTPTVIPSATATPTFTDTPTNVPTDIPTDTPLPTATMTAIPTDTATPLPTNTPLPTETVTATPTETTSPTLTSAPLPTITSTPTLRPAQLVGDIQPSQTIFQRDSQIRYDLSIKNQGEVMAENARVELTIPNELEIVEDQPLPWKLKEGENNARQRASEVYELSLGNLAPQSAIDKFILLSVADNLPDDEDIEISNPSMTIVADGDVESFTADAVAGTNVIIEAGEDQAPTSLEDSQEPNMKLFLPIIN